MSRQLIFALGAVLMVACAANADDDTSSSEGALASRGTSARREKETEADEKKPATRRAEDAGAPEAGYDAQQPQKSALTLDDDDCQVERAALDTGLDGHGWTLTISAKCPSTPGLILNVSGRIDRPYPQDERIPFLQEEGAILFLTNREGTDAKTFRASARGGAVSIAEGPTSTARASVYGAASVVADDGTSHGVTFGAVY
jgi:hypothetical protein